MPDDDRKLAKRIARAYLSSGIAAKTHRGKLFIEREDGWEGPIDPTSIQSSYLDDIRTIEDHARAAALQVVDHLTEGEREFMEGHLGYLSLCLSADPAKFKALFKAHAEGPSGYLSLYITDPEKYKALGHDDRSTRLYITIIKSLLSRILSRKRDA